MAGFEQIPLAELDGMDFLPLGCLGVSVQFLARHAGIDFEDESDDLDSYKIAALRLCLGRRRLPERAGRVFGFAEPGIEDGSFRPVVLRAYRGAPPGTVDVMFQSDMAGTRNLNFMMREVARVLGVPEGKISWPETAKPQAGY